MLPCRVFIYEYAELTHERGNASEFLCSGLLTPACQLSSLLNALIRRSIAMTLNYAEVPTSSFAESNAACNFASSSCVSEV